MYVEPYYKYPRGRAPEISDTSMISWPCLSVYGVFGVNHARCNDRIMAYLAEKYQYTTLLIRHDNIHVLKRMRCLLRVEGIIYLHMGEPANLVHKYLKMNLLTKPRMTAMATAATDVVVSIICIYIYIYNLGDRACYSLDR
jgi:hypothetical protein